MSKHNSAPISDLPRSSLARASRSRRRRSKSTRFSQSTAIVPYVGRAINISLENKSEVRGQIAEVRTSKRRYRSDRFLPLQSDPSPLTSLTVRRAYARPQRQSVPSARLHLPKAARTELEHASRPCA